MTPTISTYLEELRQSDDSRQALVSALWTAVMVMEELVDVDPVIRLRVAHKTARELRRVAARLCDHARTSRDGSCRYCGAVVVEGAG